MKPQVRTQLVGRIGHEFTTDEVQGADGPDLRAQVALLSRRLRVLAERVREVRVHPVAVLAAGIMAAGAFLAWLITTIDRRFRRSQPKS